MQVQWSLPGWGWFLLAAAAVGCLLWVRRAYRGSEPAPGAAAGRWLAGLRGAACLLVLIALARPLLVSRQTVDEAAVVAVVVEDSGSMALPHGAEGPDRWTRSWRLAAAVDSALARRGEGADLVLLRGNGLRPLRETTLAAALADTPRAVGTDLAALASQTRQSLLARPLRGLVMLTDGHDQGPAGAPARLDLPAWLVGVGEVAGPADRFLADVRHPDRVQRGEPLVVEVAVGQRDAAVDIPLTVRLLHDGREVAAWTGPGDDLVRCELAWTPDRAGLATLQVTVDPLDNERWLANNRTTLAVDVQKDRARVLMLAPVPGWDLRFLAQAALSEPRLEATSVRPGPAGPVLADSGAAWAPPAGAEAWLEDWEAVVLAGPPGDLLPDGGEALAAAVRRGLGLLVIAGDAGTDRLPRPWPAALLDVLPVAWRDHRLNQGAWPVQPAAAAPRHPVLDGVVPGTGWPPLRGLAAAEPRPGAEVLLQTTGGRPLLVAADGRDGRSLWFAGRRLWELAFWRLPAGEQTDQGGDRLLRQMLLWSALGDQAEGIALLGQRRLYEEGEFLPVTVRWLDLRGEPVTGRDVAVVVSGDDGRTIGEHVLAADPRRPGFAVGEVPPLPPGRWRLTPRSVEDQELTGPPRPIVVTRGERERTQVLQDRRGLRSAAERLGAAGLDAGREDQVARLLAGVAQLDLSPQRSLKQTRREPAAGWAWLGAAVVLLGCEWLLRRRLGLL